MRDCKAVAKLQASIFFSRPEDQNIAVHVYYLKKQLDPSLPLPASAALLRSATAPDSGRSIMSMWALPPTPAALRHGTDALQRSATAPDLATELLFLLRGQAPKQNEPGSIFKIKLTIFTLPPAAAPGKQGGGGGCGGMLSLPTLSALILGIQVPVEIFMKIFNEMVTVLWLSL